MPIIIPQGLPARKVLETEGVGLISPDRAQTQDIRPMRFLCLNLMPEKIKTENQLARLLGATPLQIEFTLMRTATYLSKNTAADHLGNFYKTFDDIKNQKFDGFIITGAPVETMEFESVDYWPELTQILDWAKTNVWSNFYICWGAQAALYYHHRINKYTLPVKKFGIYHHKNCRPYSQLLRGVSDDFVCPVSRHTEVRNTDIPIHLDVYAESDEAGLCMVADESTRSYFMFNHLEYDAHTLKDEYKRDVAAGRDDVEIPVNYFPDDDPSKMPPNTWSSFAHVVFGNWINIVYQSVPYGWVDNG